MTKYEKVLEAIQDMAKNGKECLVTVWNEICSEDNRPNYIYENDEDFFRENFSDPWEAVNATSCGNWSYNDPYVCFNGYNNLDSFYYLDDEKSPIYFPELAQYIIDNEEYDLLGIDEDELED